MKKILLAVAVFIALIYGLRNEKAYIYQLCNSNAYDDAFIPYGIKAFDVWVYNTNTDHEYYAGSVTTDYSNAQIRLSDAQGLAYDFAETHHLKNWDYICCTVTNSSNCVTKVK